jgi:hypothetical protein
VDSLKVSGRSICSFTAIRRHHDLREVLGANAPVAARGRRNHGWSTYVELKLSDIERLFGRR